MIIDIEPLELLNGLVLFLVEPPTNELPLLLILLSLGDECPVKDFFMSEPFLSTLA